MRTRKRTKAERRNRARAKRRRGFICTLPKVRDPQLWRLMPLGGDVVVVHPRRAPMLYGRHGGQPRVMRFTSRPERARDESAIFGASFPCRAEPAPE